MTNWRMTGIAALAFVCLGAQLAPGQEEDDAAAHVFSLRELKVNPATALQDEAGQDVLVHDFQLQPRIILSGVLSDWTPFQAIAMTVSCRRPLAGRYSLIIASENASLPGADYYAFSLPPRFSGTHEVVVRLAELQRVRSPRGLDQIDSVGFHRDWVGNNPPDADNAVTISRLRLLKTYNPTAERGPRLSDGDFFALLDGARPELAAVQAAVAVGDLAAARRALCEHIRTRRQPRWLVDPRDRPGRGLPPQTRRATAGAGGHYQAAVALDWQGWRRLELRRGDFQAVGKPLGWDCISGLQLSWDALPSLPAGVALHLDDVVLEGAMGTRVLGDFDDLRTGWDNVHRDLALTRAGTPAGKWWFPDVYPSVQCRRYPADWSGYDTLAVWVHVPGPSCGQLTIKVMSSAPTTTKADEILSGTFTIGNFRDHPYAFGKRIDWSANAMSDGETKTIEWNAQLNRHFHFASLSSAWWETGEEKYAQELAWQMNTWIEDNPVLLLQSGNHPYHHAWETLNTGIRLHGSWPDALAKCLEAPAFTDDIIITILKSLVEQAGHLQRWPSTGNWLTAEAWGVYVTGLLYPEFSDAAAWRRYGIDTLYRQLQEEVYPDGLQYELALGYSNWTLREFTDLYNAALLNGMEHELPADYASRLEKMYVYQMANAMPGAEVFGLNDSGNANAKRLLLDGYRLFHRPDFLYAATDGRAGEPPAADSFAQQWVGHYVMRSGWHSQAGVAHLDAGLQGRGHIHQDKLTLALAAYGHQVLVEGGVSMYDQSRWRAYQLLTRAHNAVLVDGMDQYGENGMETKVWPLPWQGESPAGNDSIWHSAPGVDYCQGWWKGRWREYVDSQQPATNETRFLDSVQHRRAVLFVKPDLWVVHDTLLASDDDSHRADVIYHVDADQAESAEAAVVATNVDRAGLRLAARSQPGLSVAIVTGEADPPVQGWSANVRRRRSQGMPMSPVPTAIFSQSWRKRADVVTVLHPFPAGQPRATSCTALASSPEAQAARIDLGAGDSYVWLHQDQPGQDARALAISDGAAGGDAAGAVLLATDGQAALVGGRDASFRLLLVHGTRVDAASGHLRVNAAATVAVLALAGKTLVVSADMAVELSLRLDVMPLDGLEMYLLDRRGGREAAVSFARGAAGAFTWPVLAGRDYELNWGGGDSVHALREAERSAALGIVPLPLRVFPALPEAPAGVSVLVQAEDFTAQGGGQVEVTDAKTGADGRSFLHWDRPGHWLEYEVDIPADGAYPLHLRHCSAGATALRAILIDGYSPHESLTHWPVVETGGWSSGQDNWRWTTVADADGKPLLFHLSKGRHVVKWVNGANSLNVDAFCFGACP